MENIINLIKGIIDAFREINAKYRTPRIKMTRQVSFWLLMLRLYLLGMIFLLIYKFISVVTIH